MITVRSAVLILLLFSSCTKTSVKNSSCINNMIETFKKMPKGNPPRTITQYLYDGQTVYYVPAQCCDQYSDLYDENCNLLGHPDGGISGTGDGKFPNFFNDAKFPIVIWKDDR